MLRNQLGQAFPLSILLNLGSVDLDTQAEQPQVPSFQVNL